MQLIEDAHHFARVKYMLQVWRDWVSLHVWLDKNRGGSKSGTALLDQWPHFGAPLETVLKAPAELEDFLLLGRI